MKNIGEGYWNYNGCDVYLAEHPKLQGKYEIYKGCDFIQRSYSLKEAKQIIIDKFGKMSGGKRQGAGRKASHNKMVMTSLRLPIEVKNGLTTSEKREAILIAFRNKFKK